MSKSQKYSGEILTVTAPAGGFTGGDPLLVGSRLFGVPVADTAAGNKGALAVEGVWDIAKDGSTIVAGQALYWDDPNSQLIPDAPTFPFAGVAVLDAAAGDSTVRVRLGAMPINAGRVKRLEGDGQTLQNKTSKTAHADKLTWGAGELADEDRLPFRALGKIGDTNGTGNSLDLAARLKDGDGNTVELGTLSITDPSDGATFEFKGEIRVQSAGGNSEVHASADARESGGTTNEGQHTTDDASLNLDKQLQLEITQNWGGSDSGQTTVLKELFAETIRE